MRFLIIAILATGSAFGMLLDRSSTSDWVSTADLPREARQTLVLIKNGGPFPYSRDGITFGNFERRLPVQQRGYYHEYTVKTLGETTAALAVSFLGNVVSITTQTTTTERFGASRNRNSDEPCLVEKL